LRYYLLGKTDDGSILFAMAIIGIVMANYFWQEEEMVIRGN